MTADRTSPSPGRAFGWAAYLASSWTWCIGMFLPVLLMRDYGWPAWFIFAIPNAVGAAAMGWTLRSPEHSRDMVRAHLPVMIAFSVVTRSFQWFFAFGLLAQAVRDGTHAAIISALAISIIISALDLRRAARGNVPWSGFLFWLLSAGLLIAAVTNAGAAAAPFVTGKAVDLLGLGLVCLFGFGFCPYLDLTFHRARIESPAPRFSFGVGFGVLFLAMVFGTAMYARLPWGTGALAGLLVAIHIASQIGFTVEAHSAEMRASAPGLTPQADADDEPLRGKVARHLPLASMAAGLAAFLGVAYGSEPLLGVGPTQGFEWMYRIFMGFYGLVFPTYALIAMVPTWSLPKPPTAVMLRAWAVASLVAMPASYLAFIRKEMLWAFPAMLVVVAAAVLARRSGRVGPERPITLSRDRDPAP